jgi:hypothetical protein
VVPQRRALTLAGMITRRFGVLLVTCALAVLVPVACGGGDSGSGDDGVASVDEAAGDDGSSDDSGSGDGDEPSQEEFQDAALEHAQCMRENGVENFPDPEFDNEGGVGIRLPEGVDPEALEAAQEECDPIMEEVAPDAGEIDPERQAEMVDQLVEVAQCMRERGYDMPDPEVDDQGRVTFGGGPGAGGGRGEEPDEDFDQDMEECQEEAGMDMPGGQRRTQSDGGGA